MKETLKDLIAESLARSEQELELTLVDRIKLAFGRSEHTKYIDPATGKPFVSFYAWLWTAPPPGVGMCARPHLCPIIIDMLKGERHVSKKDRGLIDALITDLVKGMGAAKPAGRPTRNGRSNVSGTAHISGRGGARAKRASSLAARMAESSDPKVRAAWQRHLSEGISITRAAVSVGLAKDSNAPLKRLKENWLRATAAERQEFKTWIKQQAL